MNKILLFAIAILMASCQNKNNSQQDKIVTFEGETIVLPANSVLRKKIITKEIGQELYCTDVSTFGIARAIPNNYAEIAAPFAGRITKSFVRLGQHVARYEPVFEISSPSFYEAGKMYYRAKQEMELADKNLKRQKDLLKNGVGIQKNMEEAEVNYELYKRDYENAIASLKVFKVDPEKLVLGQPLTVRSPIEGDIVENKIVIGQYLKEDAGPVAIIAELSKVWIVGQVKEKDINSIHESEEIEITAAAFPDKCIKGMIYHISDLMDEETRSVQVFIECENPNHALKPGMFVSVRFIEQPKESILIPTTSVFQNETGSFVFVDVGNNRFEKRDVEVMEASGDLLLLKTGLQPGERIVIKGGYFLLEQN